MGFTYEPNLSHSEYEPGENTINIILRRGEWGAERVLSMGFDYGQRHSEERAAAARATVNDDPYLVGGVWQSIRVDKFEPVKGRWKERET